MKKAYIIHGWCASSGSNWFPWLKGELESRGFEVDVPDMPDTRKPVGREWHAMLEELIGEVDDETYLIGHSLGCVAIADYLLEQEGKAKLVVLVSGPTRGPTPSAITGFNKEEIDWELLKSKAERFVGIYSKDDRMVPYDHSEVLAEKLDAEIITVDGRGHIMQKELPEMLPLFGIDDQS